MWKGRCMQADDLETGVDEANRRAEKREKRKTLEEALVIQLKATIDIIPPTSDSLTRFEQLLLHDQLEELEALVEEMMFWDAANTISEPKSFLYYAHFQPVLVQMLKDTEKYQDYLERFIIRFQAENEIIAPKHIRQSESPATKLSAPIHFAVLQLNESFLNFLLNRDNIDVNLRDNYKRTALMLLCENYDQCMRPSKKPCPAERLVKIQKFIKRLLEAGADFNICSIQTKLPFDLLLKHCEHDETRTFVDECVKPGALAICSTNDRNERVVAFYNKNSPVKVTVELLEIFLRYNDRTNFVTHMKDFIVNEENVKKVIQLLLHTACDNKLSDCARLVLDRGEKYIFMVNSRIHLLRYTPYVANVAYKPGASSAAEDPNYATNEPTDPVLSIEDTHASEPEGTKRKKGSVMEHRVELKGLLKKICLMADLSLLRRFLAKISDLILLNDDPLLVHTLKKARFTNGIEERNALLACAEYLATQETIHISKKDNSGNTSLHLAVKYQFESVARLLLRQRHAYLGMRNKDNETPLDYGTHEFWRKYLDTCIEVDRKRSMSNRDEIRFNMNGFYSPLQDNAFPIVPNPTVNDDGIASASCWKMIQPVDETATQSQTTMSTVTEMTILRKISESKEHMRLLIHPVLYTFIMVKWARVCHWNYLNLLLTALTIVSFGYYSVTACSAEGFNTVWLLLSIAGVVFVGMRELLQLLFLRRSYFSFVDALDIAIALAMIVVLVLGCNGLMSSFVIISLATQLSFMIGSLQSNNIATIMYMFKTVSDNFLKSFALFSPLIGAFIYAFHLMFNQSPATQGQVTDADNSAADNFNNFRTFWNATVKTLVMTTGEFEAGAIDFEGGKMLLFIVFMFFAPIVILNLINGLAVSDIAAIREKSELISISKKVMLLEQYERGVANVRPAWLKRCFPRPLFFEYQCRIHVKTKEYNKIVVQPKTKFTQPPNRLNYSRNGKHRTFNPVSLKKSFSKFPWLLKSSSCNYAFQFRSFRLPLFVNLDQSIVDDALAIIKNQNVNASFVASKVTPTTEVPITVLSNIVATHGQQQPTVRPGSSGTQRINILPTQSEDDESD